MRVFDLNLEQALARPDHGPTVGPLQRIHDVTDKHLH